MEPKDSLFRDLVRELNAHAVEYIVVGGYAVRHYVPDRIPGDIDVWIRPTIENAELAAQAVCRALPGRTWWVIALDLRERGNCVHLTEERSGVGVDLMTWAAGEATIGGFAGAWEKRAARAFQGVLTNYLSYDHLLRSKWESHRDRKTEDEQKRDLKDHAALLDVGTPKVALRAERPPPKGYGPSQAPLPESTMAEVIKSAPPAVPLIRPLTYKPGGKVGDFLLTRDECHNTVLSWLVQEFAANGVEYLLVGGHAVKQYVPGREPVRVEAWVRPTEENAHRVSKSLREMSYDPDRTQAVRFVEWGRGTCVCDHLSGIGVYVFPHVRGSRLFGGYGAAEAAREVGLVEGVEARFLSFRHLLVTLTASKAGWNQADARALLEVERRVIARHTGAAREPMRNAHVHGQIEEAPSQLPAHDLAAEIERQQSQVRRL